MLLATLPATPVQLAHACYRFGFHIVVPASWGDELVAHAVLEDLRERDRGPVIQCTCPLVSARLLANGQHLAPSMVQTASPPVAAARYARHALSPRQVRITYIGACPGAQHTAIDQRYMPDEFLRALDERDISISDMPTVFDSVLPPDRRRFESLPGGCPTQEALWRTSDGRMLREVTQPTFSTDLAQTLVWREYVMIDVAPSLGCACAGSYSRVGTRYGRVAVMALEPPRAVEPVVTFQPEFVAATVEAPVEPEQLNGDAPPPPPPPAPQPPSPPEETRETEDQGGHASRVRVRTPSSAPLPRAYLAKRRHLATVAREPAPHVETLSDTAFAAAPREAASEAAAPPNEEQDVALPIAVHVEPPLPPVEEPAAGPTAPATLPIAEPAQPSAEPVALPAPQAG
ncbi:MAG: [Fe-Fe] hydrogenase large subunit C-terminal domain-containing protein, partial [Gemmatimonadaceae bacterium]